MYKYSVKGTLTIILKQIIMFLFVPSNKYNGVSPAHTQLEWLKIQSVSEILKV